MIQTLKLSQIAEEVPFKFMSCVSKILQNYYLQLLLTYLWFVSTLFIQSNTHTHPFDGPFSRTTRMTRYQNVKPIWILPKQETVSGSGISSAICMFAPRCRQITTQATHRSAFTGRRPTNSVRALKSFSVTF